ncbi:MAG TPA: sigma-70 family RNA polymerase sigma factor [Actinomycetota bacterium]|nr:sigma-70 family RNA polymerase sigma factor [Actinomycetota bacterium]
MTERILVQAAQSGLPQATDELVERYYPRVYSFVSSMKGSDAEDLTQEVFARALHALPRFNGEYQFGAWLLQIARNVCIDEARRQVRRPQPTDPVDLVEMETTAQPDHVWESVSAQIAVTTVHKALGRLPKRQRTVLVLRELEGMSYADIAVALRISTRAVEISLSRARKRMRVELASLDLAEEEMAECRRMASMLATDPAAMSREDVAAHMRSCRLCQAIARRRPRDAMRALLGLLAASPSHLTGLFRRQLLLGQRLAHSVTASPGAATLSPLSRFAEIGASVAVATAVSAGALSGSAAAGSQLRPIPVAVPIVAPAEPAPAQAAPAAPVVAVSKTSTTAQPAAAPGLPVVSALPCAVGALTRTLQAGSGTPLGGAGSAASPESGNLLSEILSPVNALSPVLACDPTLSGLGTAIQSLTGPLTGQKSSAGTQAQQAQANPGAATSHGAVIDLMQLLQQLLGQHPDAH